MKKTLETWTSKIVFLFFLLMNTFVAFAQDGGGATGDAAGPSVTVSKSTTTTTTQNWFSQPWVWVVGAIILILIIVALVSGGRSRTEVHRTVVHKED